MSNATHSSHQSQAPKWANCPAWCRTHQRADEGTRDEFLVHIAAERHAGSSLVELRQVQFADSRRLEPAFLYLDDDEMPLADAAHLAAVLFSTVAEAAAR